MAGEEQKVRRPHRSSTAARERTRRLLWTLLGLAVLAVVLFVPQINGKLMGALRYTWRHFFFFTWLGVCALLPSTLAVAHRMRNNRRYVGARQEMLRWYLVAARHYASTHGRYETARIFTAGLDKEVQQENQPGILLLLGGGVALALPFLLVATLSATYLFPDLVNEPSLRAAVTGDFKEGLRGLVFAGYGVYVYTLLLIIHRIQAMALSSEFLLGATLRALITLVLGFVGGQVQLIQAIGTDNQAGFLYFILGAFPSWALLALRRRVQSIFQPSVPSQEALSLEYVDGINDRIAERLEELGISDIQHLATTDPGELTLRTLYPLARTLDWVDQAILVTYLREKIGQARLTGVRGAIDLREVFQEARWHAGDGTQPPALHPGERARTLLQDLATRTGLTLEAIYNIGARLSTDYPVDFLAYLRNRGGQAWPLPSLLEAIGRALEDSGLRKGAEPGPDGLPTGPFEPQRLETPDVQKRFGERLAEELRHLSLEWTGSFEELRDANSYEELYDLLLARIGTRPHEPSQPLVPSPPGRRSRLPRWLQRTH